MRLLSLFTGLAGGITGFATGGLYLGDTFFRNNTAGAYGDSFFFQFPAPIYDSSLWLLGFLALALALVGVLGGILAVYNPKTASLLLLGSAFLSLAAISAGFLWSSLLFFAGGIAALLEHRREAYGINLGRAFFPYLGKGLSAKTVISGDKSSAASVENSSPVKERVELDQKTDRSQDRPA